MCVSAPTRLGQAAVHGAFAGFTGFTVGPINGVHAYVHPHTAMKKL
jgi:hypothetical protein